MGTELGGARALDTTAFVDSLHATWIKRLLDPAPQTWKNILWSMLRSKYGHLGMGDHILVSSLDFSDLGGSTGMPPLFVSAFKAWGKLPTPQPTRTSQPYEALMAKPILYSPAAVAHNHAPRHPHHLAPSDLPLH
mgnify:CR=1 FL=1